MTAIRIVKLALVSIVIVSLMLAYLMTSDGKALPFLNYFHKASACDGVVRYTPTPSLIPVDIAGQPATDDAIGAWHKLTADEKHSLLLQCE